MFWSKHKENVYPCQFQLYYTKVGCKGSSLHGPVFVMRITNLRCIVNLLHFLFGPLGTNPTHILSVKSLTDSALTLVIPQIIHLLDRNKLCSHSVNKSELLPALSLNEKFVSLSRYQVLNDSAKEIKKAFFCH